MLSNTASTRGFESVDLSALSRANRYKLITGAVVPRPIAFVTTCGAKGNVNAAPFSQFVIVAVDPGLLGISVGPRDSGRKDTITNIETTGQFVINIVPDEWAEIVQLASQEHPADVSEVELLGLETIPSFHVTPPRLAASNIQFECRVHRICEFGDAPNHFVVGAVVAMHVREGLARDFKIDPHAHTPLARIGGRNYVKMGKVISV